MIVFLRELRRGSTAKSRITSFSIVYDSDDDSMSLRASLAKDVRVIKRG